MDAGAGPNGVDIYRHLTPPFPYLVTDSTKEVGIGPRVLLAADVSEPNT